MNELTIFRNEKFGEMRTITKDEEIWFVGKDVAEILGYSNPNEAIQDHVDSEDKLNSKTLSSFNMNLGQRGGWLINESGLYSLVLSSKLPSAKEFKRWVTSEILPSIRRHGAYMTPETIEDVLLNPDTIIRLAQQLKAEKKKVAELQPKADYYDTVAKSKGLTNFRETAKEFGIKESVFIKFIEDKKLCFRNSRNKLLPYAAYTNKKWFELKEVTYGPEDDPRTTLYTKITPLGRTQIFKKLREEGLIEAKSAAMEETGNA